MKSLRWSGGKRLPLRRLRTQGGEAGEEFGGEAAAGGEALPGRKEDISVSSRGGASGTFRGGRRLSSPSPPGGVRAPGARGRPALRLLPPPPWAGAQESETSRSRGPPRSSQAAQTLTHSCLRGEGGGRAGARWSRPASTSLSGRPRCQVESGGGWQAPRTKWGLWAQAPLRSTALQALRTRASERAGSPRGTRSAPDRRRSSPRGLLRAEGGVRRPDLIAGARGGRPLPRTPGAREGAGGGVTGTLRAGRERPRWPAGRAAARRSRRARPGPE